MQISNDWQPEPKTRLNLVKNRRYLGMAKVSVVGANCCSVCRNQTDRYVDKFIYVKSRNYEI